MLKLIPKNDKINSKKMIRCKKSIEKVKIIILLHDVINDKN